jgi:hypothetical protein
MVGQSTTVLEDEEEEGGGGGFLLSRKGKCLCHVVAVDDLKESKSKVVPVP